MKPIPHLPIWYLYLVPTLTILFVNNLISKDPSNKEYGVEEIATAVEQNRFTMSIKSIFLKVLASSLSIAKWICNRRRRTICDYRCYNRAKTSLSLPTS
ncbi:hypothetical protein [Nitratiruptor sp. YY09-18]|uniref:hypothetical protein n=1 Tax=Nitratiruptor sp. YY09-18 TaxID=2724901 RepID=UPI001F271425|nr:hypothetical protein [Nitratiruptor sp. YY09-18]